MTYYDSNERPNDQDFITSCWWVMLSDVSSHSMLSRISLLLLTPSSHPSFPLLSSLPILLSGGHTSPSHSTLSLQPLTHLFHPLSSYQVGHIDFRMYLLRQRAQKAMQNGFTDQITQVLHPGHILSTHPLNISYQYTLSTHPINTPCQYTLSTHPINTPYQGTLSTHPINTPYRPPLTNLITLNPLSPLTTPIPSTGYSLEEKPSEICNSFSKYMTTQQSKYTRTLLDSKVCLIGSGTQFIDTCRSIAWTLRKYVEAIMAGE